jgi:peptide/nickel transport system ATP-binding protein
MASRTAASELPAVTIRNVTRAYGRPGNSTGGVFDATLSVAAGEIVGIQGPSGAGKSTLLRLISGAERPDRGEIDYGDSPAWPRPAWPRQPRRRERRFATYPRPGYVMPIYQDPSASLDPRWSIWRTVTEPLTATAAVRREITRQLLSRSGMSHVDIDARPCELSGGQCQRIAILRAVVAEPTLIVADEPTARQDVITAAAMTEQLREAAAAGTGIVVVSHNTTWLECFAHRVLDLADGRLSSPSILNVWWHA